MSDEKPLTEEELNWLDSYNFWEDEQPREHEDVVHRASKEIRSLRARVKALEEALIWVRKILAGGENTG